MLGHSRGAAGKEGQDTVHGKVKKEEPLAQGLQQSFGKGSFLLIRCGRGSPASAKYEEWAERNAQLPCSSGARKPRSPEGAADILSHTTGF